MQASAVTETEDMAELETMQKDERKANTEKHMAKESQGLKLM